MGRDILYLVVSLSFFLFFFSPVHCWLWGSKSSPHFLTVCVTSLLAVLEQENIRQSQIKIVWSLAGSGACTNEHVCTVHVDRFIYLWSLTLLPHSLPLSSPSGKDFVWGFQKQDVGPALNRGQLLSIKLTLSFFSSRYRRTSQAKCLFLLFCFRCRMDISLSDGSILSKGLESALLRPFEKLQTLLLFSLSLI